jgi:hypothetical protein
MYKIINMIGISGIALYIPYGYSMEAKIKEKIAPSWTFFGTKQQKNVPLVLNMSFEECIMLGSYERLKGLLEGKVIPLDEPSSYSGTTKKYTPLYWAVFYHHEKIVKLLIEHGVNKNRALEDPGLQALLEKPEYTHMRLLLGATKDYSESNSSTGSEKITEDVPPMVCSQQKPIPAAIKQLAKPSLGSQPVLPQQPKQKLNSSESKNQTSKRGQPIQRNGSPELAKSGKKPFVIGIILAAAGYVLYKAWYYKLSHAKETGASQGSLKA